jgi:NAD(P)-dependent dehydrogenase (short-subunit alcohol dehydrogenase family)
MAVESGEHRPQTQDYPGSTEAMTPKPRDTMDGWQGNGLLAGRRALVTGGDSGIGRAVASLFAKEGADVAICYLSEMEDADAERTCEVIRGAGRRAVAFRKDLADARACREVVEESVAALGGLDIVVNNVAYQNPVESLEELSDEQWRRTFAVNIDSYFYVTKSALPHLSEGSVVLNTASINGLRGNKTLIDYAATKGAVLALTYSLAQTLREKGIRVNAVAPGPVWTPLIPATMDEERVESFGSQTPFGRAAEPDEIAPSYLFFASGRMSSYYSGEVLAPIGGETLPG